MTMAVYESRGRDISPIGSESFARAAFAHNVAVVVIDAIGDGFRLIRVTGNRYELRKYLASGVTGVRFIVDPRGRFIRAHPIEDNRTTFRTVRKMRLSLRLYCDRNDF